MLAFRAIAGIGAVVLAASLGAYPASAQTFDVKAPEVRGGYLELNLDNAVHPGLGQPDATRGAYDQTLHYGIADWWRLSGGLRLEDPTDTNFRVGRAGIENLFVLDRALGTGTPGLGLGWFTAFDISLHPDTTNTLIFGPIMSVKRDKLSFTVNPFFEKTFGRNHVEGIAFAYGWQAKYELRSGFAIGVEGFGVVENLGNAPDWQQQQHRVGPVVYTEIALTRDLKITPDIGVLFGLTEATPDVTFKFNIGVPLHQR